MHSITDEQIEELSEFIEKFSNQKKVGIIYELLIKIKNNSKSIPRKCIIQSFSKENNLSESAIYKWISAYMNSGLSSLVDGKVLAKQYLLDNPFCIKDEKIVNWSKRSLSNQFTRQISKQGYNITIGIKETTACEIIKDVVINQDELLRESGQLIVIVLDFMEESREKIMKTLRHKRRYRVVYHGADINLTSRIIEVIEKVEDKETSVHFTHEVSEENIEYLAKGILKTVVQIRKVHKWNGKLIVYMPESEVSKAVRGLLEDISIRSIEVNPKGIKVEQDEIGFSLEKIKEYKKRKFKTE